MNPALRHSAAHLFVASLDAPEPTVDDAHHLFRVLRLRDGETVTVSDGAGSWRATRVVGQSLLCAGEIEFEPAPRPVTVASAIPKGDRLEWMVQKLTEVGVAEIVFLHCERSVVRWSGERGERQLARQQRVAREASSQCRRVWLPLLLGPSPFGEVAGRPNTVIADPFGEPFDRSVGARNGQVTVMIGPEGGLTEQELGMATNVCWGSNILRVETAAVVAAASFLI